MPATIPVAPRSRRRHRAFLSAAGLVVALIVVACAKRVPVPPVAEMSGFLDDYSRLVPGGPDQPSYVYRDPNARFDGYDRILFEPVTIWRSGKQSLADIPPADLERLAFELQRAVQSRLERSYQLVAQPAPGVLRIRLGLTLARQDDAVLDVFTYEVPPTGAFPTDEPLAPATRAFVDAAALEGELSDAMSGAVLAMGVDRRRRQQLQTWGDVRAAADRWAAWFESRLERVRAAS